MLILYIIAGIIAAFFLLQFFMVLKMKLKKGKTAPELNGKAGKAIKKGEKVLFYFYSPGCRACLPMTPVIDQLMKKRKNVFKINIADDMSTAQKFGIMGTPATVIVNKTKIEEFIVGPKPREQIEALMH